jgi:nitrogen fixation protein FixH
MRDFDQELAADYMQPPRRWTGRMVLAALFVFFGVTFLANGVLVHEALSTMSGVDTDSAYQAGRMFEQEVALANAQDARQWHVDATVTSARDGARLDIVARDAGGQLLSGLQASATFERPTDRRLDQDVVLLLDAAGRFHGNVAIAAGQWDLVIALSRDHEQLFRSRNRVVLR